MDFLVFTTNHGMEYAVNIADLEAIINPGPITAVPGTPKGVIGLISYHGRLLPVIDTHELYHDKHEPSDLMMIMRHTEPYGVLIKKVSNLNRGDVPEDVRFIDPYDYRNSILGFNKEAVRVELF